MNFPASPAKAGVTRRGLGDGREPLSELDDGIEVSLIREVVRRGDRHEASWASPGIGSKRCRGIGEEPPPRDGHHERLRQGDPPVTWLDRTGAFARSETRAGCRRTGGCVLAEFLC